ncbi:MAG: hypothetical protein AAF824_17400 [Bacteroidota bacterium]
MKEVIRRIKTFASIHPEPEKHPESWFLQELKEFSEKGNLVLHEVYEQAGKVDHRSIFRYSGKGDLLAEILYKADGTLWETTTYIRGKKGRLDEIHHQYEDGSSTVTRVSYQNHTEEIRILDEEGSLDSLTKKKFDLDGNLIEEILLNEQEEIEQQLQFSYDEEGRLTERLDIDAKNEVQIKYSLRYDERGNLATKLGITQEGKIAERYSYLYDREGRLVEERENGLVVQYSYDQEGKCVKEETLNAQGVPEATRHFRYNKEGLLSGSFSYQTGDQYEIEPQVVARTKPSYLSTRIEYEYF